MDAAHTEVMVVFGDASVRLRGLDRLLGRPYGDRAIQHGDRVPVLLTGQANAADNGIWIAQDGDWERPGVASPAHAWTDPGRMEER